MIKLKIKGQNIQPIMEPVMGEVKLMDQVLVMVEPKVIIVEVVEAEQVIRLIFKEAVKTMGGVRVIVENKVKTEL